MDSYRDHPLSHLSSVSPEGLRAREEIWRLGARWSGNRPYEDPGGEVKGALLASADHVEALRAALESVLDGGQARPSDDVSAPSGRPRPDPGVLWRIARGLRARRHPNDSGSTSASLEAAADEISHLCRCLDRAAADPSTGLAAAAEGLRRDVAEPTHEAPVARM